jgi:Mrp family chromosome partitioning ATPase
MEKLRIALNKARQSREGRLASANNQSPKVAAPFLTKWFGLRPLNIEERHLVGRRIVTRVAGEAATPFDILRTKILLQMRQNDWKRLAITSPMPGSGKTTTACNLALGLGRQHDIRSILFDLDLRDPSIHEFFNERPLHGIGELLTGGVTFENQALRYQDNIAISMAKSSETDPTRILLSEETISVLNNVEKEYRPDIMIFDLPSVLVNDDTRAFLKNADCALLVVRANETQYEQFRVCLAEVSQHTNVIGVVLNAYRHNK